MTLREALDRVPDPAEGPGEAASAGSHPGPGSGAMLCGARSLYAISQWGRDHGAPAAEELGFSRKQTPSVATLHRVFRDLDREAFEGVLAEWVEGPGIEVKGLSIDGKRLRGIHGDAVAGVHLWQLLPMNGASC